MRKYDERDVFKSILKKNLIGPNNNVFQSPEKEEIISEYPISLYYSAILFPINNEKDNESEDIDDEYYEDIELQDLEDQIVEVNEEKNNSQDVMGVEDPEEVGSEDFTRKELYPNTCGLSFCIKPDTRKLTCTIIFGTYSQYKTTEKLHFNHSIAISEEDFDLVKSLNIGNNGLLIDIIKFDKESGKAYLARPLVGSISGMKTGDYAQFYDLWREIREKLHICKGDEREVKIWQDLILRKISNLYKNYWVREHHLYSHHIDIVELIDKKEIIVACEITIDKRIIPNVVLYVKLIAEEDNHLIVKVVLANMTKMNLNKEIMARKPLLNESSIFQVKLLVESNEIISFPESYDIEDSIEDKIIRCQYRDNPKYSSAHNCSCTWEKINGNVIIETDYLPAVKPPVTTNNTDISVLKIALNIKNNSVFSNCSDEEIITNLGMIYNSYKEWTVNQKRLGNQLDTHRDAVKEIVDNQEKVLSRIKQGIGLLEQKPEIFEIYKLANAVMLVNMVVPTRSETVNDLEFLYNDNFTDISYHIFQLTFLLINIESIINPESYDRLNSVDLLWFPTGGGKTEAYFLLSIFTMLYRRINNSETGLGTSIIMRYTLRLLTAQQFERASRMILSLNFICKHFREDLVIKDPFSIGLWIGATSTPNKLNKGDYSAHKTIEKISETATVEEALESNTFPITDCPWCKKSLVDNGHSGFNISRRKRLIIECWNKDCPFHNGIPIDFVDESLYNNPPTLLFATIDKFAQLAWKDESKSFFGINNGNKPPDLIIQDELHLISGPLGSVSALFEGVVETLCSKDNHKPRIIASTATIKNAASQIKNLYGNRKVFTFPPPGINSDDNFFAKVDKSFKNREYIGVYPTGKTFTTTQVKLLSLILDGRWEILSRSGFRENIDNYWTIVSYYNSLRELGRMYNKYMDEIAASYTFMQKKRNPLGYRHRLNYPKELTSRISSYQIKKIQNTLEKINVYADSFDDYRKIKGSIDTVFATNMISVGLDISRLNMMVVNGQPKCVSEYIQVTSRIARKHPGLVVSIFNPFRVRDRSHFENFKSFHESYYRYVEPISVTPYTRVVINNTLATIITAYLRLYKEISKPNEINAEILQDFVEFMGSRIKDQEMFPFFKKKLTDLLEILKNRTEQNHGITFDALLIKPEELFGIEEDINCWKTMTSMREVSPNSVIKPCIPKKVNSKKQRGNIYDE